MMGEKRLCALAGVKQTRKLGARADVELVQGRDQIADQRIELGIRDILARVRGLHVPAYIDEGSPAHTVSSYSHDEIIHDRPVALALSLRCCPLCSCGLQFRYYLSALCVRFSYAPYTLLIKAANPLRRAALFRGGGDSFAWNYR